MREEDFKTQIRRLQDIYGEKAYPQERVKILWEENKRLDYPVFAAIVSELIGGNATAPMVGKFREARAAILPRFQALQNVASLDAYREIQCKECNDTGALEKWSFRNGLSCVFRCGCPMGERKHPRAARFTSNFQGRLTEEELKKVEEKFPHLRHECERHRMKFNVSENA